MIQGWELTLRSPNLWHRSQFHLAYANQIAQATSPITGGLVCPVPVTSACGLDIPPGLSPVDHDQRNTLNVGFNTNLPWHTYASTNVYYGSGFTNGLPGVQYPGNYLPGHTTFDLALGKTFAEKYTVSVTALNVANRRVQLDNSLTVRRISLERSPANLCRVSLPLSLLIMRRGVIGAGSLNQRTRTTLAQIASLFAALAVRLWFAKEKRRLTITEFR